MNNRCLFRAKRIDNGEWVEGYLLNIAKINAFICTGKIKLDGALKGIIAPEMYAVDPFTICQCTGIKDKSGRPIWENDILMGHLDDIFPEDATYVRVMWRNNGFCTHQNGYDDDYEILEEFDQNIFEVCGNIFDNPELLELD